MTIERLPPQSGEYAQQLGCLVIAEIEPGVTTVEVTDWLGNDIVINLPSHFVRRLYPPRLSPEAPPEIKETFEGAIGLGLIACRVGERGPDDLVSVTLPTSPDPITLVMPFSRIARKANGTI